MRDYVKTPLPVGVCVQSIVSVHHFQLTGLPGVEEAHGFPELLYVEKGEHRLLLDGKETVVQQGQMILYAPWTRHGPSGRPTASTVAIVSFEAAFPRLGQLCNRPLTVNSEQRALLVQIITLGKNLFQRRNPKPEGGGWLPREDASVYELQQLKNLLELLLISLAEPEEGSGRLRGDNGDHYDRSQFEAMECYMQANLTQELSLDELCQVCGVSPSQLNRICRSCCGQAPMAHLTDLRIREAKRLIRESALNFTQIAQLSGFGSVHYFSRIFRKKTGRTPSDYARSVLKQE